MAKLQKLGFEDAVWLFNHSNGERLLSMRRPAELVADGYFQFKDNIYDVDSWREPASEELEEEEPIEDQANPYEVAGLTDADVLAFDSDPNELYHVGTTTPCELPEMDPEFEAILKDSIEDYDPSDGERENMEEQIRGTSLVELMESFAKSTDAVEYAYASESIPDGLWGATLIFTRTKGEALTAWEQWLNDNDWYRFAVRRGSTVVANCCSHRFRT